MRLTLFEKQTISEAVHRHFGKDSVAYLFGSRTRDDLRGGDIDLLIETGSTEPVQYYQKIDVLFARSSDNRPVILEAKRAMLRL
ncbi:MAG: nucleotidyltransferase domain-containing protein [Spartobacteria bacterium]|nr:nucleotidyltransferase domain-containing protein [Spartobacteria bacterium]